MFVLHPSLQRALVAYGAGALLAGAVTHAMSVGDAWSLLGSGAGALITAGALGLVRRTFAMRARSPEELEFRRLVLGIATLAGVLGAALFMLSLARWQTDLVPATSLGGVESLIEHRASVEGPLSAVPANLLRLSVGIERADELVADLEQALA